MEEMNYLNVAIIYLFLINLVTFLVYGFDKWKAKRAKWRISEATLLGLAVMGGSIGAWLGMKVWHHKTLHAKFKYGIPLILIAQITLLLLCSCSTKQKVGQTIPLRHELKSEHSPDIFLVMYDPEIGKSPLIAAIRKYKCEIVYDYKIICGMALKKPSGKTLAETMEYFRNVPGVLNAEYDRINHLVEPVRPRLETK